MNSIILNKYELENLRKVLEDSPTCKGLQIMVDYSSGIGRSLYVYVKSDSTNKYDITDYSSW